MSKTYKVTYTETIIYDFYVDASNEAEAEEKFKQGLIDGEFDLSDGCIVHQTMKFRRNEIHESN